MVSLGSLELGLLFVAVLLYQKHISNNVLDT